MRLKRTALLDGDDDSHNQIACSARRRSRLVGCGGERDPPGRCPQHAVPMGARHPRRPMGIRHRAVRHGRHSRAGARRAASRTSVRWAIEVAPRGPAAFQNIAEVLAGRITAERTSYGSISITPRRMSSTAITRTRPEFFKGRDSTVDLQPAPAFCAPAAVDGSPGHGSGAGRAISACVMKPSASAYTIHASSGYSPALTAGDFRFVPGQTAEALTRHEPDIDPEADAAVACGRAPDQVRDRLHHPAQAAADAAGGQRGPRHRREGAGLFARAGRHPGLSRGLGAALSGRARDHDHRH